MGSVALLCVRLPKGDWRGLGCCGPVMIGLLVPSSCRPLKLPPWDGVKASCRAWALLGFGGLNFAVPEPEPTTVHSVPDSLCPNGTSKRPWPSRLDVPDAAMGACSARWRVSAGRREELSEQQSKSLPSGSSRALAAGCTKTSSNSSGVARGFETLWLFSHIMTL